MWGHAVGRAEYLGTVISTVTRALAVVGFRLPMTFPPLCPLPGQDNESVPGQLAGSRPWLLPRLPEGTVPSLLALGLGALLWMERVPGVTISSHALVTWLVLAVSQNSSRLSLGATCPARVSGSPAAGRGRRCPCSPGGLVPVGRI